MKKSEIVKAVTTETADASNPGVNSITGVNAETASLVINIVFEKIAAALAEGDHYNQDNFGTFKAVERKARKGRNPQTGEEVDIPAKNAVKFVPSAALKKQVNK